MPLGAACRRMSSDGVKITGQDPVVCSQTQERIYLLTIHDEHSAFTNDYILLVNALSGSQPRRKKRHLPSQTQTPVMS